MKLSTVTQAGHRKGFEVNDQSNVGGTTAIVTCHNYARFLAECLDSLFAQVMSFERIVVVNDSSTDNTAEVCQAYAGRIVYISGTWGNVVEARMAGVASVPRGRFLLFVDADNWLDPSFHHLLRATMSDNRVGVAYGTIKAFGEATFENCQPWDYHKLRRRNYIDTCSLVRWEAFVQVGGWANVLHGLQDWLLWLKVTRAGWVAAQVPQAVLNYRVHGQSMTPRGDDKIERCLARDVDLASKGYVVTIVTLFSGRMWHLNRYARALRRLNWPKNLLRIVAVDNSRDKKFNRALRHCLVNTGITHTLATWDTEAVTGLPPALVMDDASLRTTHARAINEQMARLYSFARELMPVATDFVLSLEDDIEPPPDILSHFFRGMFLHPQCGVICGVVVSRFGKQRRLIAWDGKWTDGLQWDFSTHLRAVPQAGSYPKLTASGFMATMFRRSVWDALAFRASPFWDLTCRCYYDWAAGWDVGQMGWEWRLASSVVCNHWQSDGTFLSPADLPPAEPASQQPQHNANDYT